MECKTDDFKEKKAMLDSFFKERYFEIEETTNYIGVRDKNNLKRLICAYYPYKKNDKLCNLFLKKNKKIKLEELGIKYKVVNDGLPLRVEIKNIDEIKKILSEELYGMNENEEIYTQFIEKEIVINNIEGPELKKSCNQKSLVKIFPRDKKKVEAALNKANHSCEFDVTHSSFKSKYTGKMYVEGHHLIPINFGEEFKHSLDVESNIISLCPNCHKKIHNSVTEERNVMIEKLYNERKDGLKEKGIEITLEELKNKYEEDLG